MPQHIVRAFATAIEKHLLGHGWVKGSAEHFDRALALDPLQVVRFIAETQPDVWHTLKTQHGTGIEKTVVEWLVNALDTQGLLHVVRHGFKFYGKLLRVAFFPPAHGLNPDLVEKAQNNRLIVTRQVKFDPASEKSVDMMLSLNGLPIATVELKNPLTGQNVQHAIEQYRDDRDPRLPLFKFKARALVHFAVDPDLAYMTTRLRGPDTFFLPFNMGNNYGAGNPPAASGYATSYLWEEVWAPESFLDILARFIHVESVTKQVAGKAVTTDTVIFPRYHQLDSVRKLEAAARAEGPGHNYLVQHSAGSGKSNSIAWLAYRLAELHQVDKRVFDSVIVVTDRRVLDKQLQDTIHQFEHKLGVVQKVDENSGQLADALKGGTPVIITTLQKFPFVTAKAAGLPKRSYAVIVDEAHSSQGGESAAKMKEILRERELSAAAKEDDVEEETALDVLQRTMLSRGPQPNMSFFAFTATPKAKTLEVFGRKDNEGKPRPFHLYSMRQAVEEGFILDVLKNYTTYTTYWKLLKTSAEDRDVPKRQAAAQLARFVALHEYNIAQKTEVMVEHFRSRVRNKIGGRAKAMVVTSSRLAAVRYRLAFDKYIAEKGYKDIGVLVAFSGEVVDELLPDEKFTEPSMNHGIREKELPEKFASPDFHILLVANKYQTGFDQPLLHTMYVDKRLSGVQAVQTLSRLNRTAPGKEDTFVLDFVNKPDEIERSFQPYFEGTTVSEAADPKRLYELQHELVAAQVFSPSEVDSFCKVFYAPKTKQATSDHADLYRLLVPAVDRFKALAEDAQDDFRGALKAFIALYAFLAQVMPFTDEDLEKLYSFGRFLELRLPLDPKRGPLKLDGETTLKYYRLERLTNEAPIPLAKEGEGVVKGPGDVGTQWGKPEQVKLSQVVELLNERFGTQFTLADELFLTSLVEHAKADHQVQKWAAANALPSFSLPMKGKLRDAIVDRMAQNESLATRYLNEKDFEDVAFRALVKRIYEDLRPERAPQEGG